MKKIKSLKDLLEENVQRLYSGEYYELQHLPVLRERVSSTRLKNLIGRQLSNSETRLAHLDDLMEQMKVNRDESRKNRVVEGIIESAREISENSINEHARDAGVLSCLQQLSHYDQAECGTVCSYVMMLGYKINAQNLHQTLREEKEIDHQLTVLAESSINKKAGEELLA